VFDCGSSGYICEWYGCISSEDAVSYSKETLWHFTCESCKGWWSIAASDDWTPSASRKLYCPHCGINQKVLEDIGP
jgi:hypothetical protein